MLIFNILTYINRYCRNLNCRVCLKKHIFFFQISVVFKTAGEESLQQQNPNPSSAPNQEIPIQTHSTGVVKDPTSGQGEGPPTDKSAELNPQGTKLSQSIVSLESLGKSTDTYR